MEIKMKYKDLGSFEFTQVIQKLANTPMSAQKANHIRHVVKEVRKAKEQIIAEYKKDVMEVFGERDEKGALKLPEGEPVGFVPKEAEISAVDKANEAFGEREAIIKWRPLTPSTISDVKLTAMELDLLKDLFSEEEGPGVPTNLMPFPMKPAPEQKELNN